MLTDSRFYVGIAVGAVVVLFVLPMVRGMMAGAKSGG